MLPAFQPPRWPCPHAPQAKLASGQYRTPGQCAEDVRLIWSNCMLYNQDGSDFYKLAKKFANRFEEKFNKVKMDEVWYII